MRANPAGQAPATQGYRSPAPPNITKWPDADVQLVRFRLHALGVTGQAAGLFLQHMANTGVRRIVAHLDGIEDPALLEFVATAEAWAREAEVATGDRKGRGDLLTVRTPARWPWRTSSAQSIGGGQRG